MLVLALTDLRRLLTDRRHHRCDERRGLLGTDDVFAEDLHLLRPHPGQLASAANLRALMADSEIRESHRTEACTRVQDAYSLRCSPQVAGAVRDTVDHADRVARDRTRLGDRQPGGHPRRPGGVQRQLPRCADRVRAGLPGHRRRRPGRHHRAPHRPVPRPGAERRARPVPGRRSRRRQRPHDRAVHPGGDRVRAQTARRSGVGRLDPQLGDAGGPRLDGLVGRPEAAPGGRRAHPGARHRAAHRGSGSGAACAAAARTGHRRRDRRPPRGRRTRSRTRSLARSGDRDRRSAGVGDGRWSLPSRPSPENSTQRPSTSSGHDRKG